MTATLIIERPIMGGTQRIYRCPNGRGASVVRHSGSYGGPQGCWELAVLTNLTGDGDVIDFDLDYTTPITDDVLGWLDDDKVNELLEQIAALPPKVAS